MKSYNESPISNQEVASKFDAFQYRVMNTGYSRVFKLSDTNSGTWYSGRLYWDINDGFDIIWDGAKPEESYRDDFAYQLDSILEEDNA